MLNFKNIGIDNIFNLIENNIKYYYNCYSYTVNRFNFTFIFAYPMEIPRRLIFEINILRVSPVKKLRAPHTETCVPGIVKSEIARSNTNCSVKKLKGPGLAWPSSTS